MITSNAALAHLSAQFYLANQRGQKLDPGWTLGTLYQKFMHVPLLLLSLNEGGVPEGLGVVGEIDHSRKHIHVSHLLCTTLRAEIELLQFYIDNFSGYGIFAYVRGYHRVYNPTVVEKLICKQKKKIFNLSSN